MTDYRAELQALVTAYDEHGGRWPQHHEDALFNAVERARAALAVPVAEPPAPPADYIDPEHSGTNREMLEVFYSASLCEGGTSDEIALRGINAVLARWGQPPAPPAEGEVAELVAWLRLTAGSDNSYSRVRLTRIAELLERHPAPVPVAEPPAVAERPSDDELGLIYHDCCRGCEFMDQVGFEDAARAVLARWGRPAQPAPPADGEIDQLVSRLRDYAQGEQENGWHDDAARFRRAAELLERHAAPVPVAEPPAPPADYIDPEHSGTNREKLEVFYSATLSEGGTADEIALRGINAVLARWGQPPAPPSEGEVAELVAWLHGQDGGLGRRAICARIAELLERHAAPVPVPVAERLPQPEDCDADGKCWLWNAPQFLGEAGWWTLNHYAWSEDPTHWLPAHALPLPAPQGGEVEP